MKAHVLSDFPFGFCEEATDEILERRETRCSFLDRRGLHGLGMWTYECWCWQLDDSLEGPRNDRFPSGWDLPSALCPCKACCATDSLNWSQPLLIYWAVELVVLRNFSSGKQLYIHYLGPEKELLQLPTFGELRALFPDVQINISFIGPAVPKHQDGETIELQNYAECTENECECKSKMDVDTGHYSPVILHIRRGYYHDVYRSLRKDSPPHLVIVPNAFIAACSSWLPAIELINELNVPAIFSDYCEEACLMGSRGISSVMRRPLTIPAYSTEPVQAADGRGRGGARPSMLFELLPLWVTTSTTMKEIPPSGHCCKMSNYNVTGGGGGGDGSEGNNFGGFGFGVGISVGILLLITAMTLVTYYCTRVMQPASASGARATAELASAAARDARGVPGRGDCVVDIGMDDATIQSLFPKMVYSEVNVDKGDPTTTSCCTICLADYKATDTLRLLPDCGHLFHLKCVDPWLRVNPTCPVCRSSPVQTPLSTPLAEVVPLATRRD